MHFLTLVTTEISKIEENPIMNERFKKVLEENEGLLDKTKSEEKYATDIECTVKELRGLQNSFTRVLSDKIYEKLYPFSEDTEDPTYTEKRGTCLAKRIQEKI